MRPKLSSPSSPRSTPANPHHGDDRAASEVLGSLLLAGLTVTFAVVFGQSMLGAIPEPEPDPVNFEIQLSQGGGGWGTGEETLALHHVGGAALPRGEATILASVDGRDHSFAGESLNGSFDDGHLTIGETWTGNLTVPAGAHVDVQVLQASPTSTVVANAAFTTDQPACQTDTLAPNVSTWSQDPDPIQTSTTGPVQITATVDDDCSGVDVDEPPALEHWLGDGNVTDAGEADRIGQQTWQATIPEPQDGWQAHAGESLTYRLAPLTDRAGNSAPSENRSSSIEPDDASGGQLTYVTDHTVFSGTLANFTAAQNATDDGDAALLSEEETSSKPARSEAYATAHSSSAGTQDAGDATGSPDDAHARVSEDGEWVTTEGFQTFSGDITAVELAFQAQDENDGSDDELVVGYEIGNRRGKTSETYGPADLGSATDDETVYVNVTDDRDWSWSDVDDLRVRAEYDRHGAGDDLVYAVDALWVRVTYDDPAYNMSIRGDIGGLPAGDHTLELRYAVSDERHHVEVWNVTTGGWEQRGSPLTSTSLRSWSLALSDDEVDGNETRFRIVDDAADPRQQSTVSLDYARGRTR